MFQPDLMGHIQGTSIWCAAFVATYLLEFSHMINYNIDFNHM